MVVLFCVENIFCQKYWNSMDISSVDGNKIAEDNKPVDREKVRLREFACKPQDTCRPWWKFNFSHQAAASVFFQGLLTIKLDYSKNFYASNVLLLQQFIFVLD